MSCPLQSSLYAHDISVLDSFSASQDRSVHRAPAAHTPRPPRVGTQVPAAECRVSDRGPQQRELRSGEKCAATHSAEAECTQIS